MEAAHFAKAKRRWRRAATRTPPTLPPPPAGGPPAGVQPQVIPPATVSPPALSSAPLSHPDREPARAREIAAGKRPAAEDSSEAPAQKRNYASPRLRDVFPPLSFNSPDPLAHRTRSRAQDASGSSVLKSNDHSLLRNFLRNMANSADRHQLESMTDDDVDKLALKMTPKYFLIMGRSVLRRTSELSDLKKKLSKAQEKIKSYETSEKAVQEKELKALREIQEQEQHNAALSSRVRTLEERLQEVLAEHEEELRDTLAREKRAWSTVFPNFEEGQVTR